MAAPTRTVNLCIDYGHEKEKIRDFLTRFSRYVGRNDDTSGTPRGRKGKQSLEYPYINLIKQVSSGTASEVNIQLDDIDNYEKTPTLADSIESNTERYEKLFYEVVDSLIDEDASQPPDDYSDPLHVIIYQRRQCNIYNKDSPDSMKFPDALVRRYHLMFVPRSARKGMSVRDIKAEHIGRYVVVKGIVSRINEVRPMAVVVALSCDMCGYEIFQEVTSQTFNQINVCTSEQCKKNQIKGRLYMQTRASKLIKFQEIRIQEQMDQVPIGCIPRSMKVYLFGSNARKLAPGDTVSISGVFLPMPYTGFRAMRARLLADTYLKAHYVCRLVKSYSQLKFTPEMQAKVEAISKSPNAYERLAASIAPELYGLEDVKKILLLLLAGGATKNTSDGMRIRGDINVCLMGDPGVAKSQILKHICKISPRGVYTTGRGASGVGLTSCVVKDPVTGEFVLEGGALVMADGGVACIDEFDKMDENDRTSIHEVMEQQTISISKAGITTTLNARASILAAANPRYGRFNSRVRVSENIDLPVALLTRFDVLYLLLDIPSITNDLKLSQHVTYVHMHNSHPPASSGFDLIDIDTIRHYIAKCKEIDPIIPSEVANYIINAYLHLRSDSTLVDDFNHISTRTLLSIIRMSTALARLRWSSHVSLLDVDEALKLLESSTASLSYKEAKSQDPASAIFDIIKKMSKNSSGKLIRELSLSSIREVILGKGYLEEDLQQCLTVYQDLWMLRDKNRKLVWIGMDED